MLVANYIKAFIGCLQVFIPLLELASTFTDPELLTSVQHALTIDQNNSMLARKSDCRRLSLSQATYMYRHPLTFEKANLLCPSQRPMAGCKGRTGRNKAGSACIKHQIPSYHAKLIVMLAPAPDPGLCYKHACLARPGRRPESW